MAKEKAQSVEMTKDKVCKSCVRYRGEGKDAEAVGNSFYLQNAAFKALGEPEDIKITVSSA